MLIGMKEESPPKVILDLLEYYKCPITLNYIRPYDSVIGPDGHMYDQAAAKQIVHRNSSSWKSPMTQTSYHCPRSQCLVSDPVLPRNAFKAFEAAFPVTADEYFGPDFSFLTEAPFLFSKPFSNMTLIEIYDADEETLKGLSLAFQHDITPKVSALDVKGTTMNNSRLTSTYILSLKHLKQLQNFICELKFSKKNVQDLVAVIASNSFRSLKRFDMANCGLTDATFKHLVDNMSSEYLPALIEVDFQRNRLTHKCTIPLSQMLDRFDFFHMFILQHNFLEDQTHTGLIDSLHRLNIEQLSFYDCGIGDATCSSFSGKSFKNLSHLYLSQNAIGDPGMFDLCTMFKVTSLIHFNLSKNSITDEGWSYLMDVFKLGHLRHLTSLGMSENRLTGKSIRMLRGLFESDSMFGRVFDSTNTSIMTRLDSLDIMHDSFTRSDCELMASVILKHMPSLTYVYLGSIRLSAQTLKRLSTNSVYVDTD